jgi:Ni/Co efflux regulator RcnB
MGFEDSDRQLLARHGLSDARLTLGEIWDKERRAQKAEEAERIENARADAKALWHLADYSIPADVKEMAERWDMGSTLQEMWRGAFIQGWRAAHKRS